jgi:hypothetical protein
MSREVVVGSRVKCVAKACAHRTEGKSLVVLQVNCTSVYNNALEFWITRTSRKRKTLFEFFFHVKPDRKSWITIVVEEML